MEQKDSAIFIPKEDKVTISGEVCAVKPYSIRHVIGFTRELMEVFKNIKEKYPEMDFKEEDVAKYLPLLLDESDRLIDLVALAINKDGEWLGKQNDLKGFSELFMKICKVNDFGAIIANFREGWSLLQKQKIM